MKLCRFRTKENTYYGVLKNDRIFPVDNIYDFSPDKLSDRNSILLEEAELCCPVSPSKIVCVGRNYAAHANELGNEIPKEPLLFLKAPSSLITDGEPILLPSQSDQVEHEGELAVIIRRKCKNLSENSDVGDFILGFTCLNDVTARDLQKKDIQFTRAKSFDTFCPVGKFIETDPDFKNIGITTRVNGEIRQSGRTSEMVFPVDFLIRYISNQMTLLPGDIIATGTPAGVSRLQEGDICEIEIEGLEKLVNPVGKL